MLRLRFKVRNGKQVVRTSGQNKWAGYGNTLYYAPSSNASSLAKSCPKISFEMKYVVGLGLQIPELKLLS